MRVKHSRCPEIFLTKNFFLIEFVRFLLTVVRQPSFSSAEVFSLQWSDVATSAFSKLGQFQFGFPSTDSFRHEWHQRDFSFQEFLTGNFHTQSLAQGKLKKCNSETQRGAIFPSSFLNRSECRGSIRWQSSWATTCSMNAVSWVVSSQWKRSFPEAEQLPHRFPSSRTWKAGVWIRRIEEK